MNIKEILRSTLIFLHLDLTKNLEYDRLTKMIMKKELATDSNCIDVGCHKGEILDIILKYSPKGNHYAFEPIPYLFAKLEKKYRNYLGSADFPSNKYLWKLPRHPITWRVCPEYLHRKHFFCRNKRKIQPF